MSAPFQMPRRSFLGSAALGVAAAQLAVALPAFAQSGGSPVQKNAGSAGPLRRLEPLKHIDAGALNVAYYEAGPPMAPRCSAAWLALRHPQLHRCRAAC
jgi:hypothetical protein